MEDRAATESLFQVAERCGQSADGCLYITATEVDLPRQGLDIIVVGVPRCATRMVKDSLDLEQSAVYTGEEPSVHHGVHHPRVPFPIER